MDDATTERIVERAATLEDDLEYLSDRQQRIRVGVARKITFRHIFHHDVPGILRD